ncbi:protoporphyrinogen oxidase [Histoplasma capsulatum G186AR]|uniref:Protoporphyrinogen oxidase n=2 Tax=Ajellomyces capsulatus TaxID=5037 RepID=C0NSG1_AJECG|nr:protoporphyrinogen oxidase [Histoplasma capsulatum G186AR]EEH05827.1 protoporphyrinogen oxidase [Histoplasma capsulatum G186AR]KAG5300006.1 protoporphyrinogen oxidase [Histoplasma capsulatum]QSS67365.1 protoporphyrinogen oxidase [Histoplasma capsulatum G186AR]
MRPRCSYRTIDELWTHSCGGIQPLTWSRRLITAHAPPFCFRRFTSNPSTHHKNIAVIGAGVTGLSTAFRLSQDQDARVTLYEKAPKLGGWLQSEIINVDGGEVLFEYGPRTLRAGLGGSLSTLELLFDLGLKGDILPTETDSPAARNRYIYYPDHLVRLPGPYPGAGVLGNILMNVMQLFSEPLLWKLALEVILEPRRPVRDRSISDESIGDFMKRRFGPNVADVVASAFFHGIYAGDLYKLSARSILRIAWDEFELSERGFATELMDQFNQQKIFMPYDIAMARRLVEKEKYKEIRRFATGNNVLTLRRGMGQLATALESSLRGASNVEIKTGADIKSISKGGDSASMTVTLDDGTSSNYDYVISTTSSTALAQQLLASEADPAPTSVTDLLNENDYAVTVMVVNLYYKNPNLIPHRGFGYLIPRSVPIDLNPERALGVIFASDSSAGQDTAEGTKLTVILGGHWWDDWLLSDLPDEENAIAMAKSVLARHLRIADEPVVARARLQRDAIPQPTVGQVTQMERLHDALERRFEGRLKVAGAWYTGVGVNDSIRAGRIVAAATLEGQEGVTGLERYTPENFKRRFGGSRVQEGRE